MFFPHTHCRACGFGKPGASGIKSAPGDKLVEVFNLGVQPLANDFCGADRERAGHAPLKVMFCPICSLGQLSVVVRPEILYSHYSYVTSPSATMKEHFDKLIADIREETDSKTVTEIGSNDGKLLKLMQDEGYSVLGVDPAANLAELAVSGGVPTKTGFFCEELSRCIPQSDIVIARHVFCHVDDWKDFVRGLENICHDQSLVCIETPYVGDMLNKCEFDTVYHEHLSYLSIKAMEALLRDSAFHIHRVIRYPIHGGAILIMLRRNDSGIPASVKTEMRSDYFTLQEWQVFANTARQQIDKLRNTVRALVAQGKRVAGLGASAKSTVWINACGFTRKDIEFISDTTPQKQWTFSPGTDIPICDEGAILRELPDYTVMWCWNFRVEALSKFSVARSKGVKFIIPVPEVEIV